MASVEKTVDSAALRLSEAIVRLLSRVRLFATLWTVAHHQVVKGFSVHGIFQARVLEWVAISFSRGSSQPRNQTQVSRSAGGFFTS